MFSLRVMALGIVPRHGSCDTKTRNSDPAAWSGMTNSIDEKLVEQHHGAGARQVVRAVSSSFPLGPTAPLRVVPVAHDQRPEGVDDVDRIRAGLARRARSAQIAPAKGG